MNIQCSLSHEARARPSGSGYCAAAGSSQASGIVAGFLARREDRTTSLDAHTLWAIDLALLVACNASPELLEIHVAAALDDGLLRSEIIDAVTEAVLYAGLVAVDEALLTVMRVFATMDLAGREVAA